MHYDITVSRFLVFVAVLIFFAATLGAGIGALVGLRLVALGLMFFAAAYLLP